METISVEQPSALSVSLCTSVRRHVENAIIEVELTHFTFLSYPGFGNLGGVVAGFSFRPHDAPRYFAGHGLLIGTVSMSMILCIIMHIYLVNENKRRDGEMAVKGLTLNAYTEDMKRTEREKGDHATVSS